MPRRRVLRHMGLCHHRCHLNRRPRAIAAANVEGVELVALAVTVAEGMSEHATRRSRRAVAHAASVEFSDAGPRRHRCHRHLRPRAIATAHAQGVELVAVAVAVASRDVGASTLVDLAGAVAHAASVEFANTFVDVVTNAIGIFVRNTITSAHLTRQAVAIAVAVAFNDVFTAAIINRARPLHTRKLTTDTALCHHKFHQSTSAHKGRRTLQASS